MDIITDILEITQKYVGKTKIIYGANLNFNMANEYLSLLIDKGYLDKKETSSTKYKITKKGESFLKKSKEFKNSFNDL